jgi:hypothetical protein
MNRWRQRIMNTLLPWYGTPSSNVAVDVYKTASEFEKRLSLSNMQSLCTRTKENSFIEENYLRNWVYFNGAITKFPRNRIRRYFVAGTQGFAVGALLDPARFSGQRIFYLILICTRETSRGVGKKLMTAIQKEAKTNLKCDRIWLSSVEDRTWIYEKWGFTFGPYCHNVQDDPLRIPRRSGRMFNITSHKAPYRKPVPILNRNGKPTGLLNPLPSRFYHVRGVHRDQSRIDGYLMTKCLR